VDHLTADEVLMAAYQAGNEVAFGELFDRYAGRVFGFLVRRLGDRSLAEDLYQETFLRLHRAKHTYDSRRPFRAWLFGIVHNLMTDALRTRGRLPETRSLNDADAELAPAAGRAHEGLGASESPESLAIARQARSALDGALRALSADEATVIMLARFEGLSYDDIAVILGRSPTATKQLAYRALKRVRAELVARGHQEQQ
jgi:RNA polymerase sigma-70 factor (ECF subfamily)